MMKKKFLISGLLAIALATTLLSVPIVYASVRCNQLIDNCQGLCCTSGNCPWWWYGRWGGDICGCDNGDPQINTQQYHSDARSYLEGLGYCTEVYGYEDYSEYYLVKSINGYCRWQARVSMDNHYVEWKDGPEPNSQPAYYCNGNPDLWNPFGCVTSTIREWHDACCNEP